MGHRRAHDSVAAAAYELWVSKARRALKVVLLEDMERKGVGTVCEGTRFEQDTGLAFHECGGAWQLHEVLYPRNVFQKLSLDLQTYFWHPYNCSIVCEAFHAARAGSKAYFEWFVKRVAWLYGLEQVHEWAQGAPLKVGRLDVRRLVVD